MDPKEVMLDLAQVGNKNKDKNFTKATGISMIGINFCPWCEDRIQYRSGWDGDYRLGKCPHCEEVMLLVLMPFSAFGSFGATLIKFDHWIQWDMCQRAGICIPIDIPKKEDGCTTT